MTIRFPDGMRDRLNELAARNGRSANAEIVARLHASLSPKDSPEVKVNCDTLRQELANAEQAIQESLDEK